VAPFCSSLARIEYSFNIKSAGVNDAVRAKADGAIGPATETSALRLRITGITVAGCWFRANAGSTPVASGAIFFFVVARPWVDCAVHAKTERVVSTIPPMHASR